jgi:hypothetical protein
VNFLFNWQQQSDGSMPRTLLNGKTAPDSFGTQLDETAYPILMAWQAARPAPPPGTMSGRRPTVVAHGPAFGENGGGAERLLALDDRHDRRAGRRGGHRGGQRRAGLGPDLPGHSRRHAAPDLGLDG